MDQPSRPRVVVATLAGDAAGAQGPWHRIPRRLVRWGATDAEVDRPMPGDDRIDAPDVLTNRAVTIHATPDEIWPWLVLMEASPEGDGQVRVLEVEPRCWLLLEPATDDAPGSATWALALYPQDDGTTRLVSRIRARRPHGLLGGLWRRLLDPCQFAHERQLLEALRDRVEHAAVAP